MLKKRWHWPSSIYIFYCSPFGDTLHINWTGVAVICALLMSFAVCLKSPYRCLTVSPKRAALLRLALAPPRCTQWRGRLHIAPKGLPPHIQKEHPLSLSPVQAGMQVIEVSFLGWLSFLLMMIYHFRDMTHQLIDMPRELKRGKMNNVVKGVVWKSLGAVQL